MVHKDYLDYVPVNGDPDYYEFYDGMMDEAEVQSRQKKLKNVFKDEE